MNPTDKPIVTDEMIDRARLAFHTYVNSGPVQPDYSDAWRAALEAALPSGSVRVNYDAATQEVMMAQAAEIERLRQSNDALMAERANLIETKRAQIEQLEKANRWWKARAEAAEAQAPRPRLERDDANPAWSDL